MVPPLFPNAVCTPILCSGTMLSPNRDGKGTEGIYLTFQSPVVSCLANPYGDFNLCVICS